jgi:hypothetical protein
MNKTFALLSIVSVAGCGSAADVENFLQSSAQATCAWQFKCCNASEIKTAYGTKYTTQDQCVPYVYLSLSDELYLDKLAANEGRLKVDSTAAQACLDQMNSKVCNPKPGQPIPTPDPNAIDPCSQVFVGATAPGNECVYLNECQKGSHCVTDATVGSGRGVCVPYQQEGDICNSDSDCDTTTQKGMYCAQADFTCHLPGGLGDQCAYTVTGGTPTTPMLLKCNTAAGLYCNPTTMTCKALPSNGEACLIPSPPDGSPSCDPSPSLELVCVTNQTGIGSTCRTAGGNVGDDCSQFACKTGLICNTTTYTCQTAPGLGQPCPQFQCAQPYYCDNTSQICVQPASFSEPCSSVPCGPDLFCYLGTCETAYSDGHSCTGSNDMWGNSECLSKNCAYNSTTGSYLCGAGTVGAVSCSGP